MIKRHLLRLAAAVGAGTTPGLDDLAPERTFGDPFCDQHRPFDTVARHLGQPLQPDPCGGVDRPLEHGDNLVSDLLGQRGGHVPQHLAGGFLVPCAHGGVQGQEGTQVRGHGAVAFP